MHKSGHFKYKQNECRLVCAVAIALGIMFVGNVNVYYGYTLYSGIFRYMSVVELENQSGILPIHVFMYVQEIPIYT